VQPPLDAIDLRRRQLGQIARALQERDGAAAALFQIDGGLERPIDRAVIIVG
jgi:hypothetical protein